MAGIHNEKRMIPLRHVLRHVLRYSSWIPAFCGNEWGQWRCDTE